MRVRSLIRRVLALALALGPLAACSTSTEPDRQPPAAPPIYRIPVVVHVLHEGEPVGEGFNLSTARVERQIEILNEDFRRRAGTPGFNDHPAGADARIEFHLADAAPDGVPTDGIHRVDTTVVDNPVPSNELFDHAAAYGYWDHRSYLNVWSFPFDESSVDVVLGMATGPHTDLPGADRLLPGEPVQAEGVIVNAWHLGESDASTKYGRGRTLTHEVGHYLGLLHLWGSGDCATNDYCDDTPPVTTHTASCSGAPRLACDGTAAMVSNYMDFTPDACMNLFTADQVARMRYVLENSAERISLWSGRSVTRP